MTTHAYSQLYLANSARCLGNMLHTAVIDQGIDGSIFLKNFIQTGIAEEFENGNPKYIAGKSGTELFMDVMIASSDNYYLVESTKSYSRSDIYWVGWVLAHYQWYSSRSFKEILDTIPFNEMLALYGTLHEADIRKCYDVFDTHFERSESRLKSVRKKCGLTQEALARQSEVSLNTIRAYERKSKNLNKAQSDIVLRLSKALRCEIRDLLE